MLISSTRRIFLAFYLCDRLNPILLTLHFHCRVEQNPIPYLGSYSSMGVAYISFVMESFSRNFFVVVYASIIMSGSLSLSHNENLQKIVVFIVTNSLDYY
jgi:hypothetical protein